MASITKKNKWVQTDMHPLDTGPTYARTFSGRMTKRRWQIVSRYCRKSTYSGQRCSHEWDCCGCLHAETVSFTYKHNQVRITHEYHRNY